MATGTLGTGSRVKRLDMDSSHITTFKTVTKSVCFQMTLLLLLVLAALTYDGAFTWWRRHHDGRLVARSSLRSLAASRVFQHIHRHPLRLRTHKHGSGWGQRRTDRGGDCRGCGGKRSRQLEIAIPTLSRDPISIPVSIAGHSPKLRVCVYVLYGYTLQCVCVCVMSTHCALSAV